MEKWKKRIFYPMNNNFIELLEKNASIIEKELISYLTDKDDNGLAKCMEYSLISGGKRIRPFIVIEAYRLFAKEFDIKKVLPYACALEMIHTYSLIHDDLPCMDNDDMRRGKLTNHKVFGEGNALLAGDTLLTYAFEILASNELVSDKSIRLATRELAKCAGFSGMAGGQMIDLNSANGIHSFDELKKMHSLKTGALIRCATLLGYFAACDMPNNETISDLEAYATNVGIAFQIRDDILDKISCSDELGKPVGSDEKNGKTTSLTFMDVNQAQVLVEKMTNDAINSIEKYYQANDMVHSLTELAKFMVERNK